MNTGDSLKTVWNRHGLIRLGKVDSYLSIYSSANDGHPPEVYMAINELPFGLSLGLTIKEARAIASALTMAADELEPFQAQWVSSEKVAA